MLEVRSGKIEAQQLQTLWDSMAGSYRLHPEIRYRIRKMSDRLAPLTDKFFLKTVRAAEMLYNCRLRTVDLNTKIGADANEVFADLTRIEEIFERLLRKTYTFRIKAG